MSDRRALSGNWAVSSKQPGRFQGYECVHAPKDVGVARHLIGLGERMGTAEEPREGHPDELPWLTFAGSGGDEEPVVAVVSQEWSVERDGTGQPIVPTRAVWLPWATMSAQLMSYLSLWEAARALRWAKVDGGPEGARGYQIDLAAAETDWTRVVGDIDRFDFRIISNLAAAIVSGKQVVIVLDTGDTVSLEERVRFLDAVMALLPYGARYCTPVSTWVGSASNDAAMLAFSNRAGPGQIGVRWTELGRLARRSGKGRDYLEELEEIRVLEHGVQDIVDHLLADNEWLRGVKDISIERLQGVRLASVVYEEIGRGTTKAARVLEVLAKKACPPKYLPAYVEFLALTANDAERSEEKKAERSIVAYWEPDFGTILGDVARRHTHKPFEWAVKWLELCRKAEEEHEKAVTSYLRSALRAPVVVRDDPAFSMVANLILHHLTAAKAISRETYECLVGQPHALVDAVGAIVRPESSRMGTVRSKIKNLKNQFWNNFNVALSRLVDLSSNDGTPWLFPILLAAGGRRDEIRERDIAALAALGIDAFSLFVDVLLPKASVNVTVDVTWPVVTQFLESQGTDYGSKPRDLLDGILCAVEDNSSELSPANRARMDFWRLLAGRDPLSPDLREKPSDEYLREFGEAFLRSGWQPHILSRITRRLVTYLKRNFEVIPVDTVVRLDKNLKDLGISLKGEYLTHLAGLLKSGRAQGAPVSDLPKDWWQDLLDRTDLVAYRAFIDLLGLVAAESTITEVFDKVVLTLGHQFAYRDVLASLIPYAGTCAPPVAAELLCRLRAHDTAGMTLAEDIRDALLDGRCGTEAADHFRRYAGDGLDKAHQEVDRFSWLGRGLSTRLDAGGSR
jgi:hypothetical protein